MLGKRAVDACRSSEVRDMYTQSVEQVCDDMNLSMANVRSG